MKVYTRGGDCGQTSLYSGERVPKCDPRVDAYGSVDELQAALGLARSLTDDERIASDIYDVQSMLMNVMAELATVGGEPRVSEKDVAGIEQAIDRYCNELDGFTWRVPGATPASAAMHVARTVARRCERAILFFSNTDDVASNLLSYMNRISDLCYVIASYEEEETR